MKHIADRDVQGVGRETAGKLAATAKAADLSRQYRMISAPATWITACGCGTSNIAKLPTAILESAVYSREYWGISRLKAALTRHSTGHDPGPGHLQAEARQKVVERLAKYGPVHEQTLGARANLAGLLRELGDPAAARDEIRIVLEAQISALGPHHPSTLGSQHNLALLLGYELHEREEALVLMQGVITGLEASGVGPQQQKLHQQSKRAMYTLSGRKHEEL